MALALTRSSIRRDGKRWSRRVRAIIGVSWKPSARLVDSSSHQRAGPVALALKPFEAEQLRITISSAQYTIPDNLRRDITECDPVAAKSQREPRVGNIWMLADQWQAVGRNAERTCPSGCHL